MLSFPCMLQQMWLDWRQKLEVMGISHPGLETELKYQLKPLNGDL